MEFKTVDAVPSAAVVLTSPVKLEKVTLSVLPKPNTILAATGSAEVITPIIGAEFVPIPPLLIDNMPSTSSLKSILLTVKV